MQTMTQSEQPAPPLTPGGMDHPDRTLFVFLKACGVNDRDAAIDALTSLLRWIDRGGRLPLAPQEPS
jgi:hypothetical protein